MPSARPAPRTDAASALAPALAARVKTLRFLVVGLGSAGRRHAANLAAFGPKSLEAVSAHRRLKPSDVDIPLAAVYPDLEAGLRSRPDAVVVANPTSLHVACARRALESGAHVYLEKPAAASAEDAASLLAAARAADRVVAVGCQQRFDPCLTLLHGLLREGRLGKLLSAQVMMGEYLPDYHPGEDHRSGYAARKELGGGILLTQIHDVNYLHWLLGPFTRVFALGGRLTDVAVDVEDCVSFLLQARSGCAAAVHMDFLQRRKLRRLTLAGDMATAVWDAHRGSLRLLDAKGEEELGPGTPPDRNGLFRACLADFLEAALEGKPPRTSLEDAVADLRVVDAVKASLAARLPVEIPSA